jgi:hypothetical protein
MHERRRLGGTTAPVMATCALILAGCSVNVPAPSGLTSAGESPSPTAQSAPTRPLVPSGTARASETAVQSFSFIPGWRVYIHESPAFAFQYPPDSHFLGTNEGETRLDLPILSGTNLVEKYLDIDVGRAAGPCTSPAARGFASSQLIQQEVVINGIPLEKVSGGNAGAGNFYEFEAYTVTRGSSCVSLTFVLHSTNRLNYPTPPPQFDKHAEAAVYDEILSTFHWASP